MRSAIKLAYSMGSVAMILSGSALAAEPIPFGTTTPTTTTCPATHTCSPAPILGTGFMQREITDKATGQKYIHTIIDDGKGFKSEDFVRFNTAGTASARGIASQSSIAETATDGTKFNTASKIMTGWATASGNSEATLNFGLDFIGTTNNGFKTTFAATVVSVPGATASNAVQSLAIDQIVGLEGPTGSTDRQHFYTAIKPAATALTNFTFTGGGGTVTYAVRDPIQLVWVGQTVTSAGAFGTMTLAKADGTGTATFLTDTTATGPNFPTQVTGEFFSASPAPTF